MHILLTNDDGVMAPGIKALAGALAPLADKISVIAPLQEKSACSQSITVRQPLIVENSTMADMPRHIEWIGVDGTPTDCVKLALEALLPEKPDYLISGINRGPNLGTDVLYSGTVSAAIEGALYNVRSIAVSSNSWQDEHYETAAAFVVRFIRSMEKHTVTPQVFNINVPELPETELAGHAFTTLGVRLYQNVFEERMDPRGRRYYWMGGDIADPVEGNENTDIAAVGRKMVSITPLQFDLTHYDQLNSLLQWKLE